MDNDDNTQSFVALSKGTMVSHYRIADKIGAGGMGEVYLAEDTQLDRKVALKFLPSHLSQDEAARARFTREAKAAAKLDHPNIVQVFEVGEFHGRPFFAMAHIEGKSLKDVIKESKLSIDETIDLTKQICEGLHKAHESGVVHRDIKPGNIIIDGDNKARILDFGLATVAGEDKLTRTGSTLGTVGYMSPEQIEGKKVDHRSDLFSVGVILYEMLTGRRPFEGDTDAAVARSITDTAPEPIARYKSGTTGELQQIVDKALAKDPLLRYQHAISMLTDLRRLELGGMASRRSRLGLWAAVVGLAAIVGYFAVDRFVVPNQAAGRWVNSIAVLPFRDFSSTQDQEYFCDGMTDALIGKLSGIKSLKVISMTSVMRYKLPDRDLKEIGKKLDVTSVLEGSIQKEGDSIRIRAQLIRVKDDAHLWTEQFTRELQGVFALQDEISHAIVDVLRIQLMGEEATSLAKRETENIEAYNLYLQGRHLWRKRTGPYLVDAIRYFEQAVELDPNFVLAYSGLADALSVLPAYDSDNPHPEAYTRAREAAQIAVGLDDYSAEAHASLGLAFAAVGDVENAEREYLRALDLNPGYAWAHLWYSNLLPRLRREEEKIRQLELTLELDPLSMVALRNLADIKTERGEYAEAEDLFRRVLEITPEHNGNRIAFAGLLARAGKISEAHHQFEEAVTRYPRDAYAYYNFAIVLAGQGSDEEAVEIFQQAMAEYPTEPPLFHWYAQFVYHFLGDYEEAVNSLNTAIDLDSQRSISYNLLAYAYDKLGDTDKALWAINKALELSPDNFDYLDSKAEICYQSGLLDSSIATYRRCLELRPNWHRSITNMARAALFARQYDLADSLFGVLVAHAAIDNRGWGRLYLSCSLRHQGKFRQALTLLEEFAELDRADNASPGQISWKYWLRSFLYAYYLGDYGSALTELDRSDMAMRALDTTGGEFRHYISDSYGCRASIYAMSGDSVRASYWKNELVSFEIDSTNEEWLRTHNFFLAYTELCQGNYEKAIPLFQEDVEDRESIIGMQWLGIAFLKAGQYEEAAKTLRTAVFRYDRDKSTWPAQAVLCRYYLGQAYEAAGRTEEAIEQYEIFLDIWRNADAGLESVADAKARLARLKRS